MIVIAGFIQIDSASRVAAASAAVAMMQATAKEEGCVTYRFAADLEDKNRFLIFEEWTSDNALQAHFKAPHMAVFRAAMAGLKVLDRQIKRYEVASAAPM